MLVLNELKAAVIHKIGDRVVLEQVLTTLKKIHGVITSLATVIGTKEFFVWRVFDAETT